MLIAVRLDCSFTQDTTVDSGSSWLGPLILVLIVVGAVVVVRAMRKQKRGVVERPSPAIELDAEAIEAAIREKWPSGVRPCPWCSEEIFATAKKCKHCGEFLTDLPSSAPQPSKAQVRPETRLLGIGSVAADALLIVGSLLPWITVTAPLVGTVSRSGLDGGGDGTILVILGVVLAILGETAR